ncbi:response regulator, partial [bacterium]|nr:response regulator [bacterium]
YDFFRGQGWEIAVAENGEKALEILRSRRIDLVLTDIKMPQMDGLELIRRVHQVDPHLITIIMTGFGSMETVQVALKEGAYDYILKPFQLAELQQAVERAFERQQLMEENIRLKELAGLIEVSETINTTLRKRDLYKLLLKTALSRTDATRGSIMIYNEQREGLEIVAAEGLEEKIVQTTLVKPGQGIAGVVFQKGKPVVVSDITKDPKFGPLRRGYQDKAFISMPLERDEELISLPLNASRRVIGVLNLSHRTTGKKFTLSELEELRVLACQAAVSIDNMFLFYDLEEAYLSAIQSLALLQEARDSYTSGHSQRVTQISVVIAKTLDLSQKEIELLQHAGMLHDIGKIGIPEGILNKPGKLTSAERKIIQQHPVIGEKVLKPVKFLAEVRLIVRHHHERENGTGYPDGLNGKELSPLIKIISVADAFDAMDSNRPHRRALSRSQIKQELRQNSGRQFDAQMVDVFLKILKSRPEKLLKKQTGQGLPDMREEMLQTRSRSGPRVRQSPAGGKRKVKIAVKV